VTNGSAVENPAGLTTSSALPPRMHVQVPILRQFCFRQYLDQHPFK